MGDFAETGALRNMYPLPNLELAEALKDLQAAQGYVLPLYTTATLPAAAAALNGHLVRTRDVGAAEKLQVCLRKSDDSYEWVIVAQASS
jgi:hypothetical protein